MSQFLPKNFNQPVRVFGPDADIPVELGVCVSGADITDDTTWNLPGIGEVGTLLGGSLMVQNTSSNTIVLTPAAGQTIAGGPIYNVAAGASVVIYVATTSSWSVFLDTSVSSSGDITGPGSSTLNAVVRWGDLAGTSLKDSPMVVTDTGDVSGIGNITTNTSGSAATDTFNLGASSGRVNILKNGNTGIVRRLTCMSSRTLADTSATTLQTFTIPTNSCVRLEADVVFRSGGSCGSFSLLGTFKNIAGTTTQVTTTNSTSQSDDGTWSAVFTVSTPSVLVTIIGANGVVASAVTTATVNV